MATVNTVNTVAIQLILSIQTTNAPWLAGPGSRELTLMRCYYTLHYNTSSLKTKGGHLDALLFWL